MNTYYVAGLPYSDELYHHGIKGQKWGVRRFQNLDRTWTAAGKIRYGASKTASTITSGVKKVGKHIVTKFKRKHPWLMSDEEVKKDLERINLEKNYKAAMSELKSKNTSRLRNSIANILEKGGTKLAETVATDLGKKMVEEGFKSKAEKKAEKLRDEAMKYNRAQELMKSRNSYQDLVKSRREEDKAERERKAAELKAERDRAQIENNKAKAKKAEANYVKPSSYDRESARATANYLLQNAKNKRAREIETAQSLRREIEDRVKKTRISTGAWLFSD